MKKLASIVSALILAMTVFTLSACTGQKEKADSSSPHTSSNIKLTVGLTYVPNIQFAPFYVAEEKGYFAQEGLDITLRHHGAQESLLGALASKDEDVVFAGGDEMMQARAAGTKVVNWATMYQQYPVTLIVPSSSDIHSIADLKGKTIGLPGPYGENYFAVMAMLAQQGWSEGEDIHLSYIGYTQTAALISKQVDAVVGFSNSDTISISLALGGAADGSAVREISLVDPALPLVGVGLGSLEENIEAHKDNYRAMLKALKKACDFATNHPEQTLDISAKYVPSLKDPSQKEIQEAILKATMKLYQGGHNFGAQDAQTWAAMASFMSENKLIESPVAAKDSFVDIS